MLNPREPLWLPRGSVRAVLALALVTVAATLTLAGRDLPESFAGLVVAVVAFYFAGRQTNGKE